MKPTTLSFAAGILLIAPAGHAAIGDWYTSAAGTSNNVVAATGGSGGGKTGAGGGGWTFNGTSGVAFDYGTLSTGYNTAGTATGNNSFGATYATVEYVFNLSDSGNSVALGEFGGYNGVEKYTLKLEQYSDTNRFGVTSEGVRDATFAGAVTTFNQLVNATFVLSGATWTLYLNGVSMGTDSAAGNWRLVGGSGTLGSSSVLTADRASGTILGVATYNRSLSAAEVLANYQALAAVPEPASAGAASAALLGGFAVLRRRRRS